MVGGVAFQTAKRTIGHEKFPFGSDYPVANIKCHYLSSANLSTFNLHKLYSGGTVFYLTGDFPGS